MKKFTLALLVLGLTGSAGLVACGGDNPASATPEQPEDTGEETDPSETGDGAVVANPPKKPSGLDGGRVAVVASSDGGTATPSASTSDGGAHKDAGTGATKPSTPTSPTGGGTGSTTPVAGGTGGKTPSGGVAGGGLLDGGVGGLGGLGGGVTLPGQSGTGGGLLPGQGGTGGVTLPGQGGGGLMLPGQGGGGLMLPGQGVGGLTCLPKGITLPPQLAALFDGGTLPPCP
ncbi:MAG: hypothetical protein JWN48_5998 [Myxococcaceae bacterium]|nr:hypothetical protein [Myxococcaceae bacterium]